MAAISPSSQLLGVDQEIEVGVDGRPVAGQNDRRRVELGHDRGAVECRSGLELRAVVDLRRHSLTVEDDVVLVHDRARGIRRAGFADRQLGLRHSAVSDRTQVDDLARGAGHPEAVQLLVHRVEPLLQVAESVRAHLARVERYGNLVALAVVAHVGGVDDALRVLGDSLALEPGRRVSAQAVEDVGDLGAARVGKQADVGLRELVAEVGDEVADRAEQARCRRDDHWERPHQLRERVCVQGAGAAVGDQREVAGVVAALHGHEPQRTRHVLVDDRDDSLGGLLGRVEAHRVGNRLHGCPRRLDVERHLAAEQARREMAENDVGIRNRRLGAALAIRGRAGLGACRLGTDAQRFRQLRHVRDRAAACADGVHVHRGHLDPEVTDRRLAPDRRLPVLAERHVSRRPAHVEREDVVVARLARDEQRAGDAARRAGEDAVDRVAGGFACRHQARVGAEDVHFGFGADPAQLLLEAVDIVRHLRPHVRVHAGRQGPLVLAELGQHLGRERHREARVQTLDDLADLPLVRPVHVRVDQRDRQRLDTRLDEVADDRLDLLLVDGRERLAACIHALDRLTRVRQRRGWIGLDHDDPAGERAGGL